MSPRGRAGGIEFIHIGQFFVFTFYTLLCKTLKSATEFGKIVIILSCRVSNRWCVGEEFYTYIFFGERDRCSVRKFRYLRVRY